MILLIPGYVSTSELEQESIIYEEIYGRISIIDDVIHEDETIVIGLNINLKEGWKTYWRHSGTTGLPTVINIKKIPDMEDFEILWPKPEVQENDGNISLIYKNEILIPIVIKLNNKNLPYLFKLNIDFGVCKNICIPVKKYLTFEIKNSKISSRKDTLENALNKIPKSSSDSTLGNLSCSVNTNVRRSFLKFSTKLSDPFFESWSILEYGTDMIALLKTKKHISDQKLIFETAIDRSKRSTYLLINQNLNLPLFPRINHFFFLVAINCFSVSEYEKILLVKARNPNGRTTNKVQ
ncbi:MAG: protein-disulfide reductase DsbD domain-containing protein [Paracoccaceae bacterium]